jgi:hypothetical protein
MKDLTRPVAWLGLALLACSGTEPNEEGDIVAEKTGTIMTALAPRHAPYREFHAHCGAGAFTEAGRAALTRAPFLQQVSSTGAFIVFRTNSAEPARVEVTTLDGLPVTSAVASPDASVKGGVQKVAELRGLEPGTEYCYALPGLTEPAGFRTAPAAGSGAAVGGGGGGG